MPREAAVVSNPGPPLEIQMLFKPFNFGSSLESTMQLTLRDRVVIISLEPIERLWSCHLGDRIEFPLAEIQQASAQRPPSHWRELRAPGTYWPGLIKAGTYYSDLGRAFWYVQQEQDCICLDLSEESYYKRIVLGSSLAGEWLSQIQIALSH